MTAYYLVNFNLDYRMNARWYATANLELNLESDQSKLGVSPDYIASSLSRISGLGCWAGGKGERGSAAKKREAIPQPLVIRPFLTHFSSQST